MTLEAGQARDLVGRIQRGDSQAEIALCEYFGPRIHYLARGDARVRSQADDVRSEALLRAIGAIRAGKLRTAEALPGFVLQIARNVIQEFSRRGRRLVSADDGAPMPEPSIEPAALPDPGASLALRRALMSLNDRDRLFFRLHYYEECSREEIARRLGVDEARVRLIKSRALQRLRDAYEQMVQFPRSGHS